MRSRYVLCNILYSYVLTRLDAPVSTMHIRVLFVMIALPFFSVVVRSYVRLMYSLCAHSTAKLTMFLCRVWEIERYYIACLHVRPEC